MAHTDIQEMWKEGNNAGELDSPPFECEQVTIILKTIFDCIMGLLQKSLGSGSNMVLQGSKGVGKTSILKAVRYYLNSKHSNELECTYFDLSGPEFSLVALDILLKEKANDDKLHVLLIDEIQLLYTCKDKDSARELSAKIANMAKKNNFLFIVTGSCSRLTEYLFHHDQPTEEQKGYADFNCTVFDEQRLFPLRNKEDVTKAYNLWKSDYNDEIDIADVFSITGGIGRLIQAHATTAHLNCPSVVDYLSDELSVCPIIFNLFDLNRNVKSCWEQIAISKVDALELIIKSKGCDHAEASKQLAYFVDKNILYLRDNYCEILRFRWISELQELKENHDFLVNYALYSCLVGWKKEGSPGSFVELYLLQKLHENSMLANVATVNDKIKLALGSSIVENTLYRMKYDFGLDGIWFWKEDRKWRVSGVQLKLGMLDKNITQGGDMDCKKQNDGTIRGIFSKAVKGFSKAQEILDKFLARHEPFILDEFYLVTSKTVKPEYYDNYSALWTQSETVMTKLYNSKKETDPDTKFPKIVSHNLENFQFKVIDQSQFLQILPTNVRSFLNLQ